MVDAGFAELQEETVEFAYELTDLRPYQERAFSVLRLIPEKAWRQRTGTHGGGTGARADPMRGLLHIALGQPGSGDRRNLACS